jgi:hypothetical protein
MSTTGSMTPPNFTVVENWQDKFHRLGTNLTQA